MVKKIKQTKNKRILPIAIVLAFLLVLSARWLAYHYIPEKKTAIEYPKSIAPVIDGNAATEQVGNFYESYIKAAGKPDRQKIVVNVFGNKNLSFYSEYYRHGFDPITCSIAVPIKTTASLVSSGPTATVKVDVEYPDSSKATIMTTVVLNEGMEINSITCPGAKGNLPPS